MPPGFVRLLTPENARGWKNQAAAEADQILGQIPAPWAIFSKPYARKELNVAYIKIDRLS